MSNLRPYYNPATFRSPIKGYDELGLVTTSNNSAKDLTSSASQAASGGGKFEYLDNISDAGDTISGIGLSMLRVYSRIFVSQPWEVSRLLLQVGDWSDVDTESHDVTPIASSSRMSERGYSEDDEEDEEDEDEKDSEMDYFTAVTGENLRPRHSTTSTRKSTAGRKEKELNLASEALSSPRKYRKRRRRDNSDYPEIINTASIHFLDIFAALNEKDGFKGVWRALNTSFIIDALGSTIEAWLSGFLSSLSGVPDPHFVEVLHSPNPLVSLGTAVCAGVFTAVVLSPIDIIRTRMTVTSFDSGYPRSFRTSMWQQESFLSPAMVLVPTVLHSSITTLINKSTPYLLYTRLGIDNFSSPSLYNLMTLISSLFESAVKLPLETIMRRAHVASLDLDPSSLIVRPVPYKGVVGTIWSVVTREDSLESLFRGWRVSVVGTIGEWGVKAIQSSEQGRERF